MLGGCSNFVGEALLLCRWPTVSCCTAVERAASFRKVQSARWHAQGGRAICNFLDRMWVGGWPSIRRRQKVYTYGPALNLYIRQGLWRHVRLFVCASRRLFITS